MSTVRRDIDGKPARPGAHPGRSGDRAGRRASAGQYLRILSSDRVWARLFATNLAARGCRTEHGDLRWLGRRGFDFAEDAWLVVDLGAYVPDRRPFYRAAFEHLAGFRRRVVAVLAGRWPADLLRAVPATTVISKDPDMRVMVPSVLGAINGPAAKED